MWTLPPHGRGTGWIPRVVLLAGILRFAAPVSGATGPAPTQPLPADPVIEVARELVPLPGVLSSRFAGEVMRSKAPPLANPPPGAPAKRSVAEQLGSRITGIRVVWYDTNRVESATEVVGFIRAWWHAPTWPMMNSFAWADAHWGARLIHAEIREADGSVGWLLVENGFPSARAAWKDGAGHWRFTHHSHQRELLLASERPERILPQLATATEDLLARHLSWLATVGDGDDRVVQGILPYVHHTRARVRTAALSALAAARQPAPLVFEALNQGLQDPDPAVRAGVLRAILHNGSPSPVDPRFLPAVLTTLADPEESVRTAACTAAGQLGREGNAEVARRVVGGLAPRLRDPMPSVRHSAATAMATLWQNGREAIPVLAALPPDPDGSVRQAVASALKSLREVHERPIEGVDVDFGVPIPRPPARTGAEAPR